MLSYIACSPEAFKHQRGNSHRSEINMFINFLLSLIRVLNFVKQSESYKKSREDIISLINNLKWKNGFYRRDIGFKVIDS